MKKVILETDLCRIIEFEGNYRIFVKMSEGGWVEHNPLAADLRGLVAALTLAVDVCAGKFWPMRIHRAEENPIKLLKKGD